MSSNRAGTSWKLSLEGRLIVCVLISLTACVVFLYRFHTKKVGIKKVLHLFDFVAKAVFI